MSGKGLRCLAMNVNKNEKRLYPDEKSVRARCRFVVYPRMTHDRTASMDNDDSYHPRRSSDSPMVAVRRVVVVVTVSGDPWSPLCMRSTLAPATHEDGRRATERETDGPKVRLRRGRAFFDEKRPTVLRWAGSGPDRMDCDHPGTGGMCPGRWVRWAFRFLRQNIRGL